MGIAINVERAVNERYGLAAKDREQALCCPIQYDPKYLAVIPDEILELDYGCGDPSTYVREGDIVLDLGSGAGKICYIAAQMVGPSGRVIGIDANDEMLALSKKYSQEIGERIGSHNVEFRKGRIQDLRLDLSLVDSYFANNPVTSSAEMQRFNHFTDTIKAERPLVSDESVDLVLSNCVLNLVRPKDKEQLFQEIFRVVRIGGRVAISDIVSDEDVPLDLMQNPELWSGCISGAYREDAFLEAFDRAGFYGMQIVKRDETHWRIIRGIEFRAITVVAHKGKQGPCMERRQAVVYRGPWRSVTDDDGHVLERGKRMAVCDKTFRIYNSEPYKDDIFPVEPFETVSLDDATVFDCHRSVVRDPGETKGLDYKLTNNGSNDCGDPRARCC